MKLLILNIKNGYTCTSCTHRSKSSYKSQQIIAENVFSRIIAYLSTKLNWPYYHDGKSRDLRNYQPNINFHVTVTKSKQVKFSGWISKIGSIVTQQKLLGVGTLRTSLGMQLHRMRPNPGVLRRYNQRCATRMTAKVKIQSIHCFTRLPDYISNLHA